jgi:hypothetical protein
MLKKHNASATNYINFGKLKWILDHLDEEEIVAKAKVSAIIQDFLSQMEKDFEQPFDVYKIRDTPNYRGV